MIAKNTFVGIIATILILFNSITVVSQVKNKSFTIKLKSRNIETQELDTFSEANNSKYLLMQFETLPKISELKQQGITSLNYINKNTIFAKIDESSNLDNVDKLRWVSKLQSRDKISEYAEKILQENPHAEETFVVTAQRDVSKKQLEEIIINAGGTVSTNQSFPDYVQLCTGDKNVLDRIKEAEEINWIIAASSSIKNNEPVHYCVGAMTEYGPIGDFVVHDEGWDGPGLGSADLTYYFANETPDISGSLEKQEVVNALNEWSNYVDVNFTETNIPNQNQSINILWGSGEHGDGFAFDGPSNTLAHCFFPATVNPEPIAGDMHFDEDETWSINSHINLHAVALHEAGHGLGLGHSDNPNSVMYAYYSGPVSGLTNDDINAAKSIYAERSNVKMPVTLLAPSNNEQNVTISTLLEWNNVSEATSYNVKVSISSDFNSNVVDLNTLSNSFSLTDLDKYTNYYWKVQAVNNIENGDWSNVFKFTTEGTPNITILTPVDNAQSIDRTVNFSWQKIDAANSYRLQIATDSLFRDLTSNLVVTDTLYNKNLQNNTQYYWRVYASLSDRITDWSDTRNFLIELKSAPLKGPADESNGISVSPIFTWYTSEGADYYSLQISKDEFFSSILVEENEITDLSYSPSIQLENSTKYYWRVKSFSRAGNYSQWSTPREFTTIFSPPVLISPVNNSDNLVLQNELKWHNVKFATYWLQISKDAEFTQTIYNNNRLADSSYTADNLEENTKYFWRVKTIDNNATSDWSEVWSFTTGSPPVSISNNTIDLSFDHSNGSIEKLTYKPGSGKELVNKGFNEKFDGGLERIAGETDSKCVEWYLKDTGIGTDSAIFVYTNSSYGSKKYTLRWSNEIGFEMDIQFDFSRSKVLTSESYWKPGGNNAALYDSIRIINKNRQFVDKYISYPEKDEDIFSEAAYGVAFYDARFDEVAGYKFPTLKDVVVTDGKEKLSIVNSFNGSGIHTIQFAVKNTNDFWTWIERDEDPTLAITNPKDGDVWYYGTNQKVEWSSFELNDNLNIKLSYDGGANFPITLAQNIANTGQYTIQVPNTTSTDCVLKIESVTDATINATSRGKFTITESGSVFFIMPDSIISAPTQLVEVPFIIKPNGNQIGALDAKIKFNNEVLSFNNYILGNTITPNNGWKISVNDSTEKGWIQVGAYANDKFLSNEETAVTLVFEINSTALVGTRENLLFDTEFVSAADSNANTLQVTTDNGFIIFHTMFTGDIRYYSNNVPISGAKLKLVAENPDFVMFETSSSEGTYLFTPVKPGGSAVMTIDMEEQIDMAPYITSGDALKAFRGREGGPNQLTPYEKIAANVNNDNIINSTDAFAILRRATGSFDDFKSFGLKDWAFIDAGYKINKDNWSEAPTEVTFDPVNDIAIAKDLIAIIHGNVNGSYVNANSNSNLNASLEPESLSKSMGRKANINLGYNLTANSGDLVEVPVKINPNYYELGSLDFKVKFDTEKLKLVGLSEVGDLVPSEDEWITDLHSDTSGVISFGGFIIANKSITESGTVFSITFRVKDDLEENWSSNVEFAMASCTDTLANLIAIESNGIVIETSTPTDITDNTEIPTTYSLSQNYPNPFNPTTNIKFTLASAAKVSIKVYNSLGQEVKTLTNQFYNKGLHTISFNAIGLASGVYFYRIHATGSNNSKDFIETKRMILLK